MRRFWWWTGGLTTGAIALIVWGGFHLVIKTDAPNLAFVKDVTERVAQTRCIHASEVTAQIAQANTKIIFARSHRRTPILKHYISSEWDTIEWIGHPCEIDDDERGL